ncbi:MAG: aspartate kinase [Oscillospiraceae bacterium]|jgi:aspartate kinase
MLIVQKFGGGSVADAAKVNRVAGIITDTYCEGNDVVVVISAQGNTTDDLLARSREVNPHPSRRELDMLLTAGEQMSVALVAMALERMGIPVVSLTGWQIGLETTSEYGNARIKRISTERIQQELDKKRIVLIAGFQGVNKFGDITSLGRGGSSTTAVALAARLEADKCQIYTEHEGVFTAEPDIVPDAKKLNEITYDEMLELGSLGSSVLRNRAVEMAKRYNVVLEVLSSSVRKPGTTIKEVVKQVEQMKISGIVKDSNVASIAVMGLPDEPGIAFKVFRLMSKAKINVDIILQSHSKDNTNDIIFTIEKGDIEAVKDILGEYQPSLGFERIETDEHVAKISIVGAGMISSHGIASLMFEALYDAKINIKMISTSEIKVSVLIDEDYAEHAIQAIHAKFFN